ncbi:hypothetical protein CL634_10780 [bacterium]|nr:hypothetical protein [bacterium]|tara:strand:+ start:825 stop:1406 length:582 start_codon:yes stop_codon:yes gene_type:complete
MAINITVGAGAEAAGDEALKEKPKDPHATISLKIRKTLDGDFVIYDHEDLDIIISPPAGKIIAFPKDTVDEEVYHSQMRLFNFLAKKGVTDRSTIQAGNVYNAIEARVLEASKEDVDSIEVIIYTISKFIEEERPHYARKRNFEDSEEDRLADPSDEESTELGEVPHAETKGAITPGLYYRPYLTTYHYFYQE